jgi:beta-mannosidase
VKICSGRNFDLENTINTNLNGPWRYSVEDRPEFSESEYDDSAWKTMDIPSNWFLGGLDHHGVVWFRREFHQPLHQEYSTLHFDGVDYFAAVYLNGVHLGGHTGYFEPFAFDTTGIVRSGKNILAVRVDSPYEMPGLDGWHLRKRLIKGVLNHHDCRPGGGWESIGQSFNTGGIWNRVYLVQHGAVTVDRMHLHADMAAQPPALHIALTIRSRVSRRRARIEVRCSPHNFKGKPGSPGSRWNYWKVRAPIPFKCLSKTSRSGNPGIGVFLTYTK